MVQNKVLDTKWQRSHLKKIKQIAKSRYTPELNVDLPIAEIFDGIGRTENFYVSIRKHHGKLNIEFNRVSQKYQNMAMQALYKTLRNEIIQLSILLDKHKKYGTQDIPWEQIRNRTIKAIEILSKLSNKLRKTIQIERQKIAGKQNDQHQISERLNSDIRYLYETRKELEYFEELSSKTNTKARLSNTPFLLLTGSAGTGKTHLLCDVVENRITGKNPLPAVLVLVNFLQLLKIHLHKWFANLT